MPENVSRKSGSRTAQLVAAVRAGHYFQDPEPHILDDPFAVHFAGPLLSLVARNRLLHRLVAKGVLGKYLPIHRWVLGRARFVEEALDAAVQRGVDQYVILGSGFDSFALRRPDLPATIFEVDLAATHARRRRRLKAAGLEAPENARAVDVDFERDDLAERLRANGFRADRRCFVNWMGVTYYLARNAIESNLRTLEALAAPGSELAFDYAVPIDDLAPDDRNVAEALLRLLAREGEPFVSHFDPDRLLGDLSLGERWEPLAHPSADELRHRYQPGVPGPWAPFFRLPLLRRRGG